MPKLIAPHGASWRGRALAASDVIEVSDAEAVQLVAHGFVLAPDEQNFTGTADILSASALPKRPGADGTSAVPVTSTVPVVSSIPAAANHDINTLPRKDLLKLLGGRGLGKLFGKPTDELRALAAIVLAGDALAEANDGAE